MTNLVNGSLLTLPTPIRDATPQSIAMLRERCSALGIPTWRADSGGVLLQGPIEKGTLSILLGSLPMTRLIGDQAKRWSQQQDPEIVRLFPGCWGIPLAEYRRRDRIGTLIALAMGAEAVEDEFFHTLCSAAHLDVQATRRALLPRTRFDELSARTTRDLLLFMAGDLTRIEEHDSTTLSFTRQLTDCYETIDLLYSLGRSMNDLTQPETFMLGLCERLNKTLVFGYVGACFIEDPRLGASVSGKHFVLGDLDLGIEELRRGLLESRSTRTAGPLILTELSGRPIVGAGQILALPIVRSGGLVGFVFAGDKQGDDNQVSSYDIQLLEAAAGYAAAFLDNAVLYADQQDLFLGTIEALTASIDAKDPYTCGHSERVARYSRTIARHLGVSEELQDRIWIGAVLHDVGKIGIEDRVLKKGGVLTAAEYEQMKLHTVIGAEILGPIEQLREMLPIVRWHHEAWNGRGYPDGLRGEEIPLLARIVGVADTFDAITTTRPYQTAHTPEYGVQTVTKLTGTRFDAKVVTAFLKAWEAGDIVVDQVQAAPAAETEAAS